ncbi:MAG: pyridoxamine 5'-phosphate oxidase family protein [Spirochaetaceae bacterium]|jgi:uncharacterized pyridoxamine 5'-phosphate oxidase family protein|nr:pyridoxamine 5'-phosphate oxidase family protein [Spirochaetaceae bacterium]
MFDYISICKENPIGVLATINGEKIKTRMFLFLFAEGKKAYFSTSEKKPVCKQLNENPSVSFCTHSKNFEPVISLNGKAVFVEDPKLKVRALEESPLIKEIFKTPGNPDLKLFYIDIEEIETFLSNEGIKNYLL